MKAVHTCAEGNACMHARAWAQRPMQVGQSFLLGLGSPEPAHDGTGAGQAGGAAHPEIGRRRLSTFCKKTNLCSGCQAPRWSLVWLEKCQPIVLRLSHARIRLSGRDMPISLHHALKMTRGTSCSLPSGSTMESTGVCCSSVAMLCEWRTEAAQAANGLA